eukprot:14350220-Ditylum_brightwellii.AAC.1
MPKLTPPHSHQGLSIASEHQHPTSLIVSGDTHPMSKAMAPPARSSQVDMLEGWIPNNEPRAVQCCEWSSDGGMVGFECEGDEIDGGKERRKGICRASVSPLQYLPGQRRKKNVIARRLQMVLLQADAPKRFLTMYVMRMSGMGRKQQGAGSFFVYTLNCLA